MMEEEIRTIPLSLESTVNGISVSIPWAQRQANGAVIVRVHMQSTRHSAGEMLLNDTDLIAIDADERPLRTQVRRFWGYTILGDVTAAHLQTARFDVGFRLDLLATGGQCGLSIAIIRTFRPGEGPKIAGGPWVFKFRVADDQEVATLVRAEATRVEAAQREQAQREQAQREAAERDAAQREIARQARARAEAEAERGRQIRVDRPQQPVEPRREQPEGFTRPERTETDDYAGGAGRGRRPSRFGRPDRGGRDEPRRERTDTPSPGPEQQPSEEPSAARYSYGTPEDIARRPLQQPAEAGPRPLQPEAPVRILQTQAEVAPVTSQSPGDAPARPTRPRVRAPRAGSGSTNRTIEDAVMGPAETALEEMGERPRLSEPVLAVASDPSAGAEPAAGKPAGRIRAARPAAPRAPRTRKSPEEFDPGAVDSAESSAE